MIITRKRNIFKTYFKKYLKYNNFYSEFIGYPRADFLEAQNYLKLPSTFWTPKSFFHRSSNMGNRIKISKKFLSNLPEDKPISTFYSMTLFSTFSHKFYEIYFHFRRILISWNNHSNIYSQIFDKKFPTNYEYPTFSQNYLYSFNQNSFNIWPH